ncbi:MAG: protein translocase subunit SecF [Deltaproteobacteria bacterium]|nr:protein translocase subunit SecF [Deltaproteobacteria bacterium]
MELAETKFNIPFMRYRHFFVGLSLVVIIASVMAWFAAGKDKYGVDFLGGAEIVVRFDSPVAISSVREVLQNAGISGAVVQEFERGKNEFSVRTRAEQGEDAVKQIRLALEQVGGGKITVLQQDYIGPTVGSEIRRSALIALCIALVGILIYVSYRFEFNFAVAGILALAHDVIISAGVLVMFGYEVNSGVVAALLTIIGYSINDTIVIFDRIRENLYKALKTGTVAKKSKNLKDLPAIIDLSVNQTLSRTLLMSLTVFFVVVTLWLFGGGAVVELSFTLLVGVVVGTYSTIFVASPIVVTLENISAKRAAVVQSS